jgi:hypothetical protein
MPVQPVIRMPRHDGSANQVGQVCTGEHPDHTKHNDQRAEQRAIQQQSAQAILPDAGQYMRQLQADENEYQTVQNESKRTPEPPDLQPDLW